jgi:hypothetical protein
VYAGLIDGSERADVRLAPGRYAYVHVISGEVRVNGTALQQWGRGARPPRVHASPSPTGTTRKCCSSTAPARAPGGMRAAVVGVLFLTGLLLAQSGAGRRSDERHRRSSAAVAPEVMARDGRGRVTVRASPADGATRHRRQPLGSRLRNHPVR